MLLKSVSFVFSDADFTIPNVLSYMNEVEDHESLGVLIGIRNPKTRFEKLKQQYPNPEDQKREMIGHWFMAHPLASWSLFYQALYMIGAHGPAAEIQKKYLSGQRKLIFIRKGGYLFVLN